MTRMLIFIAFLLISYVLIKSLRNKRTGNDPLLKGIVAGWFLFIASGFAMANMGFVRFAASYWAGFFSTAYSKFSFLEALSWIDGLIALSTLLIIPICKYTYRWFKGKESSWEKLVNWSTRKSPVQGDVDKYVLREFYSNGQLSREKYGCSADQFKEHEQRMDAIMSIITRLEGNLVSLKRENQGLRNDLDIAKECGPSRQQVRMMFNNESFAEQIRAAVLSVIKSGEAYNIITEHIDESVLESIREKIFEDMGNSSVLIDDMFEGKFGERITDLIELEVEDLLCKESEATKRNKFVNEFIELAEKHITLEKEQMYIVHGGSKNLIDQLADIARKAYDCKASDEMFIVNLLKKTDFEMYRRCFENIYDNFTVKIKSVTENNIIARVLYREMIVESVMFDNKNNLSEVVEMKLPGFAIEAPHGNNPKFCYSMTKCAIHCDLEESRHMHIDTMVYYNFHYSNLKDMEIARDLLLDAMAGQPTVTFSSDNDRATIEFYGYKSDAATVRVFFELSILALSRKCFSSVDLDDQYKLFIAIGEEGIGNKLIVHDKKAEKSQQKVARVYSLTVN